MAESIGQQSSRLKRAGNKELWLGLGVGYRVADAVRISHADLRKKLKKLGLEEFMPREPRDDDVFRRVATSHQRKRVPTATSGVFENYLIRDVGRAGGSVVKQIVVEQVDAANKRLAYEPAVQLEFTTGGPGGVIDTTVLPTSIDTAQAENLAELIELDYQSERGHLNGYAIREMIRKILNGSSALPFLTGGVYFIQPHFTPQVEALEALKIPGAEVHSFPIIDDTKQRAMLRKSIEAETNDEMDRMLKEIEELQAGDEITADRYAQLTDWRNSVLSKGKDYAEMLDETLGNTEFRMKMVNSALRKLFDHIKA